MLSGHPAKNRIELLALELDHRPALLADQMVVERITVVVVEDRARAELDPPEEAGVDQLGERAVNGCPADILAGRLQVLDQLFGVEVRVLGEDVRDEARAAAP